MKCKRFIAVFLCSLSSMVMYSQTLSLEQCKQMAIEKNTSIRIKHIHLKQAEHLRKAAYTQFFPSLGFTGTYIRMNKQFQLLENDLTIPVLPSEFYDPEIGAINSSLLNNPSMMPLAFVMNPETGYPYADVNGSPIFQQYAWLPGDQLTFGQKNNFLFNLGLIQPIYTGGKIRQMYKMSQILEEMAKNSLSLEEEKQLIEIEELYWNLITLQEKNKLANTYKNLLITLIGDLENYKAEGIVMHNDLLKVQIKLNEAELNIVKSQNGIKLARKALCQKIGLPLDEYFEPADTVIPSEKLTINPEIFIRFAQQNRSDVKMLENTVLLTEAGIKIMRSRFLPDIGFTANYAYMNPNPYAGFSKTFGGDYNLGIAMHVPLFHWGERKHTLALTQCENKTALLMLEDSKNLIALQTEQAINNLNEMYEELIMTRKSLELANENLRLLSDAFEEGMCKSADLIEAQVLWQEAYSKHIDSKATYRKQVLYVMQVGALNQ